jgi:hypothetical protein
MAAHIDYKVSGETTVHPIAGPACFNSFFDSSRASPTQNAKLTITLRVKLRKVVAGTFSDFIRWPAGSPTGSVKNAWDNSWVPCMDWPDVLWIAFIDVFKKEAEWFWSASSPMFGNQGFCLIPPADWDGLAVPSDKPTHRAHVDCDFFINWASGDDDAHVVVQVAFLAPGAPRIGCWINSGRVNQPGRGFLTYGDLFGVGNCNQALPDGTLLPCQTGYPIPHEIGHAIGLPHPGMMRENSTCMTQLKKDPAHWNQNIPPCNTGDTVEEGSCIMSYGRNIMEYNVLPWSLRAAQHTHTDASKWRISLKPVPPFDLSSLKHFGWPK